MEVKENYRVKTRVNQCCHEPDEFLDYWLERNGLDRRVVPQEMKNRGVPHKLWHDLLVDIENCYKKNAPNCWCFCPFPFMWPAGIYLMKKTHRKYQLLAEKWQLQLDRYGIKLSVRSAKEMGQSHNEARLIDISIFEIVVLLNEKLDSHAVEYKE